MLLGAVLGGKKADATTCHPYLPRQRASSQPAPMLTRTQPVQVATTLPALSSNWDSSVPTVSHTEGHL